MYIKRPTYKLCIKRYEKIVITITEYVFEANLAKKLKLLAQYIVNFNKLYKNSVTINKISIQTVKHSLINKILIYIYII